MTNAAKPPRHRAARSPDETAAPFFSPDTFHADSGVLYQLRLAQVALGQLVNDEMALEGSTLPQWVPLYRIHRGDANTVADLARKCTVDAGAMTRLLDRLERKGLCRRVRCDDDRRVVRIELTPDGVALAERVPQALCRVYNAALDGFTPAEWAQLQRLLARLTANAERLAGDLSLIHI